MKLGFIINLLALLLLRTASRFTFFESGYQETSYYKCIKPSIASTIILLLYSDKDKLEQIQIQNIKNALAAGLMVELVILPYRCRTVDEDIKFISSQLDLESIDKIWVALEDVDRSCSWSNYTPEENCQYLMEFIAKWESMNKEVEIATQEEDWIIAFKNQTACPEPSASSLLWIVDLRQKDYKQIGGWKSPYMTYIGPIELCSDEIEVNLVNSKQQLVRDTQ